MNTPTKRFMLDGKVCIITGGAGLLGSVFSQSCLERNAKVILADVDEKRGGHVVEKIRKKTHKDNIIFQKCDITNTEQVAHLVEVAGKRYGKIDALVNSAYPRNKQYGRKFEDVSYEDFCENVNMHLGGYFLVTKEVSKVMMRQYSGTIILLGSTYGFSAPKFEIYQGTAMTVPVEYASVKGAILNLTRYLASYLAPYNIRVNAISPGGVFDNQPKSFVKKYSQKVRLGSRMAYPDDIAGTLIFLLSDESQYITGQNIVVDGGWTI